MPAAPITIMPISCCCWQSISALSTAPVSDAAVTIPDFEHLYLLERGVFTSAIINHHQVAI
ncbi:hypothetical protein O9929_21085 [Vibrio lentus]|nr:hypothetical protein [Vibrio lentus]